MPAEAELAQVARIAAAGCAPTTTCVGRVPNTRRRASRARALDRAGERGVADQEITLTVNGERRHGRAEARKTLADFLREDGAHEPTSGAEHGVCGACTVLVDA
jgi:hypothetical protein